ncbi:MAG TPA: pyrimidine dimer DNA glycosylase/endonuclease V [Verrucomicrobiae bacterium]|nr:pyrimidine dimer DNA glycosylase/endonuclease V [Verrucomicrobiae bacterium]
MRIWTLHPRYLDTKGLVAAWREALLAQKVLQGRTRGYTKHPQLARFRSRPRAVQAIAAFLAGIADEAQLRGYHFDASKISRPRFRGQIEETQGQLLYEWKHLLAKLRTRAPHLHRRLRVVTIPDAHPLFSIVPGAIREWEKAAERPGLMKTKMERAKGFESSRKNL